MRTSDALTLPELPDTSSIVKVPMGVAARIGTHGLE
jgi:hypothetical protein